MIKLIRRWWKYLTAKLSGDFEARADPKVQLEQAIREAQDQHRRLKEQAANVIANQKQTELRLNRRMEELEKANNQARQALTMADDAAKKGVWVAGDSRAGRAATYQVSWELHRAGEILRQVSDSIASAHNAESRITYTHRDFAEFAEAARRSTPSGGRR